jgi:hypothetical protein
VLLELPKIGKKQFDWKWDKQGNRITAERVGPEIKECHIEIKEYLS